MPTDAPILIDPTPDQLLAAVRSALAGAGCDPGPRAADLRPVVGLFQAQREGWYEELVLARGRPRREVPLLTVWWTDHIGRRHVRVLAHAPSPGPFNPPLTFLYPGVCVRSHRFGRMRLLAVCDCGAWGEPASLGWMGPCCGPCHDRGPGEGDALPLWQVDGPVRRLTVASDGAVASWVGHEVSLWRPPRLVERWGDQRELGRLRFSPGGRFLGWEERGRARVQVRDLTLNRTVAADATAFTFHPDGAGVFLFAPPDSLVLWDLDREARRVDFRVRAPLPITHLAASPDGRLLATLASRGLSLWDARTGHPLARFDQLHRPGPLVWSPDGATLAIGTEAGIALWDPGQGRERLLLPAPARRLTFHPDSGRAVTHGEDALQVWSARGGTELRSLTFTPMPTTFALSPDGRTMALGGRCGTVRVLPADMLWEE